MTTTLSTLHTPHPATPAAARKVLGQLAHLRHGSLSVQLPGGTVQRMGAGEPAASITLHNWKTFAAVLAHGDIGLADSYAAGHWSTPSLPAVLRVLTRNRHDIEQMVYGRWWGRLIHRVRHLLRRNSRNGSRRNIQAHYDLGNSFYDLWLDETMNYSAALFGGDASLPMPQAQAAKMARALRQARVEPGSRVLEIGCGWGALAEMAAANFGAHVTGVTLSTEQLAYAVQRLAKSGMADRAQLRLQDYRDISDAPFDAVCSLEMVEAVGREYWPTYFGKLAGLLKLGGRACIQTIVIDERLWPRYIAGTDFIQQYIFPGGCLPSRSEFERHAHAAGLEVKEAFAFGGDYEITLRQWRERFLQRLPEVRQLGFDDRFIRIWDFYLAYCEAAFAEGNVDVVQYTLERMP
jgi:cyclopropane-fatty-acyl-phospholipid synthase